MKLVNLLLGGWTGVVFLFLYIPIFVLIAFSFNNSRLNVTWEGFTTKWYRILWDSDPDANRERNNALRVEAAGLPPDQRQAKLAEGVPDSVARGVKPLLESLKNSLIVATISTVASVLLGTVGAWLLYRFKFRFQRMITTLALIPMIIPEIIMGISLLIFFAMVNNLFNPVLHGWGFEERVLRLGFTTIIIAHVTFCFPFVMVAIQARLSGLDPSLEEAAMDLGATPTRAFWLVMVPFLLPAIVSGALMSFTLSMDELIVTYFVYSPDAQTFPIRIFGEVKKGLNPSLNAISTLFILATAVLVVTAEWIRARAK